MRTFIKSVLAFIGIVLLGCVELYVAITCFHFFVVEVVPDGDLVTHSVISDEKLSGKMDLYYDGSQDSYWLKYTGYGREKAKLIWRAGDIHGKVIVEVVGEELVKISCIRNEDSLREDEYVTLDLKKKQTGYITPIRKLIEFCY